MCKISHILSVINHTIRGAVCFQFTHFLVTIERIYIFYLIIIIKSEVWTITYCLGLGHETMVCAVCLFVFLTKKNFDLENYSFKCFKNIFTPLPRNHFYISSTPVHYTQEMPNMFLMLTTFTICRECYRGSNRAYADMDVNCTGNTKYKLDGFPSDINIKKRAQDFVLFGVFG